MVGTEWRPMTLTTEPTPFTHTYPCQPQAAGPSPSSVPPRRRCGERVPEVARSCYVWVDLGGWWVPGWAGFGARRWTLRPW